MKRCAVPVPSADEFFSATNGDVSRVTWAPAVNNRQELEKALNGKPLLEFDDFRFVRWKVFFTRLEGSKYYLKDMIYVISVDYCVFGSAYCLF